MRSLPWSPLATTGHSIVVTASGDVYTFGANQEGELCRKEGRGEVFVGPGLIDGPRGMFKDACSSEVGVSSVQMSRPAFTALSSPALSPPPASTPSRACAMWWLAGLYPPPGKEWGRVVLWRGHGTWLVWRGANSTVPLSAHPMFPWPRKSCGCLPYVTTRSEHSVGALCARYLCSCCGIAQFGQRGGGPWDGVYPTLILKGQRVSQLACGESHITVSTAWSAVFGWGLNDWVSGCLLPLTLMPP
jgi:hypothetical protein